MSTRIKFFRESSQAQESREFFNAHGIKTYLRERSPSTVQSGEEAFGTDLFVLREEDVPEAKQLLDYEYGRAWGEDVSGK